MIGCYLNVAINEDNKVSILFGDEVDADLTVQLQGLVLCQEQAVILANEILEILRTESF